MGIGSVCVRDCMKMIRVGDGLEKGGLCIFNSCSKEGSLKGGEGITAFFNHQNYIFILILRWKYCPLAPKDLELGPGHLLVAVIGLTA